MDAPTTLVFLPLVKGNEALGTRSSWHKNLVGSSLGGHVLQNFANLGFAAFWLCFTLNQENLIKVRMGKRECVGNSFI